MRTNLSAVLTALIVCAGVACKLSAATVSDDFDPLESLAWGNESGNWSASAGSYGAGTPHNFPNAYTALNYDLTELELDVDILNVADGGVWLHSEHTGSGSIGVRGILLVSLSGSLYWHDVTNDSNYGSSLMSVNHSGFTQLRVSVVDNGGSFTYSAFIDGSATAATSYTSASFSSGRVALYSNSAQRFDNFSITASDEEIAPIPLPAAAWFLAAALATLRLSLRKRD